MIVYNKKLVSQPPRSRFDLEKPAWHSEVAMANPLFGTTATEAAALFEILGAEKARAHYRALHANGIRIVDGNSVAADWTAQGEVRAALTDTDDALAASAAARRWGWCFRPVAGRAGEPEEDERESERAGEREKGAVATASGLRIRWHLPPLIRSLASLVPPPAPLGTLLIPNTVALIKGAPHPENGRRLIDYLLSPEVEATLARGGARQIPLRAGSVAPAGTPRLEDLRLFAVDFGRVAARSAEADAFLKELFAR